MKKGGYLIIDLLNHKLSDTPVIIEGVYNTIADNDEKMLLISGMMEDDILYDDMVGFAVPNGDVIEVTVGTKKLTITVDDEITISNAGGGGGGSVNVINSLTSDSTSDALSAKQGKVLKGLVDDKLPSNQGSENAGKYLKVADDGSVEYAAGGGGGSVSVIDNLTSDSSTDALSAKQGKALKTLIDTESGTRLSADATLEIEIDNINGSADPWENTKNYVKGDLVLYSSKLFMCISNNINQAPVEGTYWTRVSLGNFGGFQFRDNNGVAEYRKSGADTWSPFKSGGGGWTFDDIIHETNPQVGNPGTNALTYTHTGAATKCVILVNSQGNNTLGSDDVGASVYKNGQVLIPDYGKRGVSLYSLDISTGDAFSLATSNGGGSCFYYWQFFKEV